MGMRDNTGPITAIDLQAVQNPTEVSGALCWHKVPGHKKTDGKIWALGDNGTEREIEWRMCF